MEIEPLTVQNILSSEVHSQHTTFDFDTQDGERDISFHFDLTEWNKSLRNHSPINERFEYHDESILGVAAERFDGVSLNGQSISATLTINDKDSTFTRNDLIDLLVDINNEIQTVIDEKLGVNLEIYLKEKGEEAQHEKEIDFENGIRNVFCSMLKERTNDIQYSAYMKSNTINSDFDFQSDDRREDSTNRAIFQITHLKLIFVKKTMFKN